MPLSAPASASPLIEGDSLSSQEFLRRCNELPDLKHAELIGGIVYLPSPESLIPARIYTPLTGLLIQYAAATTGCEALAQATTLMGDQDAPQPDLALRILPDFRGSSGERDAYLTGAPELVIEVVASSYARDILVKKRLYERTGVREYVIVLAPNEQISWYESGEGGYQLIHPLADQIFRSRCYPGLWLDPGPLWRGDTAGLLSVLRTGLETPEHANFVSRLAARKR